ncbi:2Fe-2S iron-sulfur cluster binding domain-containing protein [Bradyrhizobium sp. 177]|uniref:2Fe-2S iron-sulfur cluster-binding protein n=1 Tax=Bradyrhizobium sp. 177 TaxID=2782647 RepID=UPI0021127439|nr:2Fe-2S iron-sulfur cluster-binding protein [Bradyrhizobium sp. 177]MCK1553483.1 2Fe-2S iron-sulfur cluster binding domain-containing protein [Bradyrhizobium sp. 177]
MPIVYFVCGEREYQIAVPVGTTLMRAAVDNGVPGIDGDCNGECACGTCHVYVDSSWLLKVGERTSTEKQLLSFASAAGANSRLACRVLITQTLDGLRVRMPDAQH